jgi:hypothetical protein
MKATLLAVLAVAILAGLSSRAEAGAPLYYASGSDSQSYGSSRTVGVAVGVPLYFHTNPQYTSSIYGSPGNPRCYFGTRSRYPYYQYQSNPWYTDRVYVRYETAGGSSFVKQVQLALAQRGYYGGVIDGVIGPMSQSAIRQCQQAQGLRPTGVVDEPLLRALGVR